MQRISHIAIAALLMLSLSSICYATEFVTFTPKDGAMCLWDNPTSILNIQYDSDDHRGISIAVGNLVDDITKVKGEKPLMNENANATQIVIGSIDKSRLIKKYLPKKLQKQLQGKNEMYVITSAKIGKDNALLIAGSDRRGTIYGIYELSRQMGVSPWYWWADVPVESHKSIYINKGVFTEGEPAVKYRGIFLNDEWPCLGNWANEKFGGLNSKMYTRIFELVLRLKGNFMWPAMWNSAFYVDDPMNGPTADEMGVIMGTSHHEPLGRAQQEWTRVRTRGPWNYDTNKEELTEFWRGGVERMKNTEDVLTIGMRGNGDEPMSAHADVALLEKIVADQREIIEKATGRPADTTPQVWALYKEVQEYYEKGMRVPDDVILLLCDDNWGDVRLLPDLGGKHHPGGYGMYYHVDYVGGARNSKWMNVSQVQRMWEQLQLTYTYGVDKLWILNVGDLKPMEFPIDFFLKMAWNPSQFNANNLMDYTEDFCRQQFGEKEAKEAARILNLQCKYAYRKTAELLDKYTYSLASGEWEQKVNAYDKLAQEALIQYNRLPQSCRDAYYQLILFPVQAMANIYRLHYAYAQNDLEAARQYYDCDSVLCAQYNLELAGGKWNHMMDQIHIGYTSWQEPRRRYFPTYDNPRMMGRRMEVTPSQIIEADEFVSSENAQKASWTLIPYFGLYKAGIAVMPYTESPIGASISYKINQPDKDFAIRLHFAPTFPFNNNEGQSIIVKMDNHEIANLNINKRINEYAWQGNRINIQEVRMTLNDLKSYGTSNNEHTLTLCPLNPGIVLERIDIVK